MTLLTEKAIRNIPHGWIQVTEGQVIFGDMCWNGYSEEFETEGHGSTIIGTAVDAKHCVIRKKEEQENIKVRFKSLKKVLKENPELILTEHGNIATNEQINKRNGEVTLNSMWTANLGKDYTFHAHTTLMKSLERFIEREYDDTHMLTWDRIDKTKESWLTVKDLLDDKDYKGAGIQFEQLRDHIAVIISKLHDYDKKSVSIYHGIETRDKLLAKKNHEIDSLQCTLDMSRNGYEATIKDLKTQLKSINSNSKETIMKRKFTKIIKA